MAYIHDIVTDKSAGNASSMEVPLSEHDSGDVLLVCVSQNLGTGTFSITGYTLIGTQAVNAACRQAWFYKVAGASETPPTASSTVSDDMIVSMLTIKDADTADLIEAQSRTDWSGNTSQNPSSAPTTAENECLLIYSWLSDTPGSTNKMVTLPGDILIDVTEYNELFCIIGHKQQQTAGAVPQITAYCEESGEGGNAWVIAINNATSGGKSPDVASGPTKFRWYGQLGDQHESITWNALSGMVSTIDGTTVNATSWASTFNWARNDIELFGGYWSTSIADPGEWVGMYHSITSTDMDNKLFSIHWAPYGSWDTGGIVGAEGLIAVFKDSSGNWAAFKVGVYPRPNFFLSNTYADQTDFFVSVLALSGLTPFASSGTMDWTDVVAVGYGYKRKGSSTFNRGFSIGHAYLNDNPVLVGGSAAAPCTPVIAAKAFQGVYYRTQVDYVATPASIQGYGQVVTKGGFQIGNGSTPTYFNARAMSHEFPRKYSPLSKGRIGWQEAADFASIVIYASASDTIYFRSCILATDTKQTFQIHASSSTSATYDFSGMTISGYAVNWKAGITCSGAIFARCYEIDAAGGTFDECVIRDGLDAIALTTTDLGEISNCAFTSGGSGHAIEITTPGTYSFVGNTFSGYGANDTTDAAIYNNSGGSVTINVSGGDTPTVRNGAGASTVISSTVQVLVYGLKDNTEVRIYNNSTGAFIDGTENATDGTQDNRSFTFSVPVSLIVDIIIFNLQWILPPNNAIRNYTVPSVSTSIPISQVKDRNYKNPE